ncbi:hypothetical protein RIR_jg871.t2 [Rhizophagus irregularis DAOM 181602=DAOM 197198]|nr:hypothetical protein RIR_jg871.t2 [Rhizophagus irregularis DAOM 181602=DAOM 197198]
MVSNKWIKCMKVQSNTIIANERIKNALLIPTFDINLAWYRHFDNKSEVDEKLVTPAGDVGSLVTPKHSDSSLYNDRVN